MLTNTKRIEKLESQMEQLSSDIATLTAAVQQMVDNQKPVSGSKKTTTKTSSKTSTKSKKTQQTKAEGTVFNRSLYEETAKKLGCFYNGQVCATVKDGVVLSSRKQNREKVYKAMGYKK